MSFVPLKKASVNKSNAELLSQFNQIPGVGLTDNVCLQVGIIGRYVSIVEMVCNTGCVATTHGLRILNSSLTAFMYGILSRSFQTIS
jgi:hypothetical protein